MRAVLPQILKEILNPDYTLNEDKIFINHAGYNFITSIFKNVVLVVGRENPCVPGVFNFLQNNEDGWLNHRDNKGELVPLKEEDLNKLFKSILTTTNGTKFTALLDACANNSLESVREIFRVAWNIYEKDNDIQFLKDLLLAQNKDGFTPLRTAFVKNNMELAQEILNVAKEISQKESNNYKFLKNLLSAKNEADYTLLGGSCRNNSPESVQQILNAVKMIPEEDGRVEFLEGLLLAKNHGEAMYPNFLTLSPFKS